MFPFLITFTILFFSSSSKSIKYIYVLSDEGYHLVTTLGYPYDATLFEINLSSDYSYITPLNYNRTRSTSVKSISFEKSNIENATCEHVKERIELVISQKEEYVIDDLDFLYYNRTFSKKDSMTFAHKMKNEFSLLHNLHKRGFIEHLRFGLIKRDEERGYFYFGDIPHKEVMNYSSVILNTEKDLQTWSVKLNKFYIGDKEYSNEFPMKFELSQRKLLLPLKIYELFQKEIFTPYVANKTCVYKQQEELYECSGEGLKYFPSIDLILDNIKFSLKGECLYKKIFEAKTYMIGKNTIDEWVIGVPFFEKYPVLFDYEKSTITVYGNTTFEAVPTVKQSNGLISNLSIYRYIIFGLLMIIGLAMLIIFYARKEELIQKVEKEKSKDILLQDI